MTGSTRGRHQLASSRPMPQPMAPPGPPPDVARLMAGVAQSARLGAEATADTAVGPHLWSQLESYTAAWLARAQRERPEALDAVSASVASTTEALLVQADPAGSRSQGFMEALDDLKGRGLSWGELVSPAEVDTHVLHAVVWVSEWHLLAAGVPLTDFSKRLGHTNPHVTAIPGHAGP